MKIDDAIFSVFYGSKRLGTCFATEINGIELIITCKHIFENIEDFANNKFIIKDSKYNLLASIIEVSDPDIVVLIPDEKLPCSKLYLIPNNIFVEYSPSLGMYGYSIKDSYFSGTLIDGIKYIATTPPYENIVAKIPEESRDRIQEGLSGSPLIWGAPVSVFGMFVGSSGKYGEAVFVSSSEIYNLVNSSKKIKLRRPNKKSGTIPDIEGIWEFRLDDQSNLIQINGLDIYSRGYIHLLQDEDELHGTAINLLFFDKIKEKLFATFIYEIIGAKIIEEQFGTVSLKCTCHLCSRTYSLKDKFAEAGKAIDYIENTFPENVTLDLGAVIDINVGKGKGAWKIRDTDRKGEIKINSYKYKFLLPAKGTSKLKKKVFSRELKRNIEIDYLDKISSTIYHVIQNHKGEILAQCRETPFQDLETSTKKHYSVENPNKCVYLSKLCVDKIYRFKGLDRRLGANTIRTLYNKGYREFVMNCCRHHAKLYERLGFVVCGEKYNCPEVNEEVFPYRCDVDTLINNPLLHRFII